MPTIPLPAVALAAVPKRRAATLELAVEIESRGFAGIYCPSLGDAMGLSQAIAHVTDHIPFGTSIVDIYVREPSEYAQAAAFIQEISGGRFRLGVGVSHDAMHKRSGVATGRPLGDMRTFVEALREVPRVGVSSQISHPGTPRLSWERMHSFRTMWSLIGSGSLSWMNSTALESIRGCVSISRAQKMVSFHISWL